jgi:LuxR family transcriptional regulator, maltose regulon positive regulatory protein
MWVRRWRQDRTAEPSPVRRSPWHDAPKPMESDAPQLPINSRLGSGDREIGMAATRLRPPAPPTRLVQRTRLADVLDASVVGAVPFLLVSAPAGSGKSTLLAAWAEQCDRPVAWLQIEPGDSDQASFWSSLIAAIGRCRPDIAELVGPLVAGSHGDDRVVVPALINAVADSQPSLVVVIDDYYLIDNASV